jgi:serine phosphatase RsbU (regulator of sigma subunit)
MAHPAMTICQGIVILSLALLGGFIFIKRRESQAGRLLALLCLLCAAWVAAVMVSNAFTHSEDLDGALLARDLAKTFVAAAMATFVAFAWYFPRKAGRIRPWHGAALYALAMLVSAGAFTRWDTRSAVIVGGSQLRLEYGFMHYLFIAYVALTGLLALATLLVRHARSTSPLEQLQIQYVAVGIGISYVLGTLFCLVLPTFFNWEGLFFAGTVAPLAGCLFMAYAIVKYRAMEIEVVLNRTFPWLLTSFLLLLPVYLLIHFAGDWIRELDNLALALFGTLFFFPIFFFTLRVQPFIDRLVQREFHAMRDAIDGLIAEAGELNDPVTLARLVIRTTREVLNVSRVVFLCYREECSRYVLIESDAERVTDLTSDDPFLRWMAGNAVVLERQQLVLRRRHQAVRQLACSYFDLVGAEACLTFVSEGRLIGTLNLGRREGRRWNFSRAELELLTSFRAAMTMALENARLYKTELDLREKRVQAEYFARELEEAHQMQESLLPGSPPEVAGLEVVGRCRPAREVGGDFYDYLALPDNKTGIVLGDVSGKGLKSAMQAVLSCGLLRTRAGIGGPPDEILEEVSRELYYLTERNMFTALSLAVIDRQSLRLDLVNAGQPYPLLKRDSGLMVLKPGGIPLGALPRANRRTAMVELRIGDLLVFFSDGVSDASNSEGEMYGEQRLCRLLGGAEPGITSSELSRRIWDDLEEFVGGAEPFDDITLVVARITDT